MKTWRLEEQKTFINVCESTTCELCRRTIAEPGRFDVDEVRVERRVGSQFPEGDFTTTTYVDICSDCFKERLLPWLRSQGAAVYSYDSEDGMSSATVVQEKTT